MVDLALPPDRTGPLEDDKGETEDRKLGENLGGKDCEVDLKETDLGKTDRDGDLKKSVPSWVAVAADKKALKKYEVEVSTEDGVHTVEIPDEILENSTPLWEDFVVGKFLDQAPHVAKVHTVLNRIWRYGDLDTKVEVYEVNTTTMRFKISSHKAREKVLRRGMWNILGVPMVVSKWTPRTEDEQQEEEAIPMWVHIEKVPLHLFSWEGLSFVASPVGFPVKLHPETIACTNFDVAKVFVKVDVTKTLPKEITFSKGGKTFTAKYYYPWLPARCSYCDKWGHGEAVCAKKGRDKKKLNPYSPKTAIRGSGVKDGSPKVVTVIQDGQSREQIMKSSGKIANGNEQDIVAVSMSLEEKILEESEVNVNKWALVSPAKSGKMQNVGTKNSEDMNISESKFSALAMAEEEEGEILEEEDGLCDGSEQMEVSESDILEDNIFDQQEKMKIKSGTKKGRGKGQGTKAQAANPAKSTRPSRRKN